MSEVLDQSDIDALLNAVEDSPPQGSDAAGGDAGADSAATATRSQQTHWALEDSNAQEYDFKRPERVGKDQIRAISSIHEVFARNFGATLSGQLRTIVDLRVVGVEQVTYNEFIHSLPNPTCFIILQAPPLEGQMCIEVSPLIVYPIVERLQGGNNSDMFIPQRSLTSIEWGLIRRIISRGVDHLSEVWRNLVEAKFEILEFESNPQLVHIVAPTEVVVSITFEIKLSTSAGTMSLCVPYNTIESVLSTLTTQSWFYKPKAATDVQQKRILRNLSRSPLPLTAYLGESKIRLSDLRGLRPGDILRLDKRTNRELLLQIGGRNKFAGYAGQVHGHKALRLTRPAAIDEPL